MSYLQAIVIGVLQGITELFPISSLGHSVLLPAFLGWDNVVGAQPRKSRSTSRSSSACTSRPRSRC